MGLATAAGAAQTYYVDAVAGSDAADGATPGTAWQSLEKVNTAKLGPGDSVLFRCGQIWRGSLKPQSGAAGTPVTYGGYGEGAKPALLGSVAANSPADWTCVGDDIWATAGGGALSVDVGNIIFDEGADTGVKKWSPADLKQAGDYFYDAQARKVTLRSEGNPAEGHRSIELALKRHIIDQSNRSYVTYEGLALRYGAAHGVGGSSVRGIVVRDCDLSFIGGGHQMTRSDGAPVRYGNGVEFWGGAGVRRRGLPAVEIYDAARPTTGDGTNGRSTIVYAAM
jgi:hypothetical protein